MDFYPPGPTDVPANLTLPTRAYRLHAWLALLGLFAFIAGYLALTGWFGYVAFRTIRDSLEASAGALFLGVLLALPPAFLCAFLLAGALAVKNQRPPQQLEITEQDEPKLFSFLRRLAREARAPTPHRVFLSPRVNAGVFYDISVLNLIFPSKKNLEIGLGLVDVLTVAEFKAVLAHEFGHFAQSTMAVGRWTYLAQQIAGNIVATRGVFDRALRALSNFDFRVAWIGWLMQLLVWSLRAVLDTAFRAVILAGRALSREMELQADLVSVSLTGSDCLVHALRKLGAADEANARALGVAQSELESGRPIEDLFAVQARVTEIVRAILGDPDYGAVPPLPAEGRAEHRVFAEHFAQPPKMWQTHPPNREREDNAKRQYLPSLLDERPSWILFSDPAAVRRQVTRQLLAGAVSNAIEEAVPTALTLEHLARQFDRGYHDHRYRARYLGPSIVREAKTISELYAHDREGSRAHAALDTLYPASLSSDLERWRELDQEHAMLVALREGALTAPGGLIRHRGRDLRRRDLARAIEQVERERSAAKQRVLEHDRACRTAHAAAARALGGDWEAYLQGLVALLHYADHTLANVEDAAGHLSHVFAIVTADGKVSKKELQRLLESARCLHAVLARVVSHHDIALPPQLAARLQVASWAEALPQQPLIAPPSSDNVGPWLDAIGSWVNAVCGRLSALSEAALEGLLETEAFVALCLREHKDPGQAPARALVPAHYDIMPPGTERPRQKRLDLWDRIQLADGYVPGALRLSVAGSVLGGALMLGGLLTQASVHVYNGHDQPLTIRFGELRASVGPMRSAQVDVPASAELRIQTYRTRDGSLLEAFQVDAHNARVGYVYNVAGSAALMEWTATYGNAVGRPPKHFGHERWFVSNADVWFQPPPASVRMRGGGATRTVLSVAE